MCQTRAMCTSQVMQARARQQKSQCAEVRPRARTSPVGKPAVRSPIWCWRCWFTNVSVLRRSAGVALFVGTVLTILNQGDLLLTGPPWPLLLLLKIVLTYCVPFLVATYGAVANGPHCPHDEA